MMPFVAERLVAPLFLAETIMMFRAPTHPSARPQTYMTGATWVSIHNGGGVGWGEVINGGFGMVIDGSEESDRKIREMLFWDVNNGIARRSWARNKGSIDAIKREMERTPGLKVTLPNIVDDEIINNL